MSNSEPGTGSGGYSVYSSRKNASIAAMDRFPAWRECTLTLTLRQSRPPLPREPVRSTVRLSHGPRQAGIETDRAGRSLATADVTMTLPDAACHAAQLAAVEP